MKKIFKKLLAVVSTVAIISTSFLTTSAILITTDYPNFERWISESGLKKSSEENNENFYKEFNGNPYVHETYHIKYADNDKVVVIKGFTYFEDLVRFDGMQSTKPMPSDEELSNFLKENNLKAQLDTENKEFDFKLKYDEDVTSYEEISFITDAIAEEFDVIPVGIALASTPQTIYFKDVFEVITLAGDLDLDNDTGLADIVILSKYNSNAEIYPISDETARANADVNNDGEINSLDINILIEQLLGGFESAV